MEHRNDNVVGVIRAAKLAAFLALALVAAGCANKPNDPGMAGAGHASPGSPQDFVVNVGDRVFFESDSSDYAAIDRDAGEANEVAPGLCSIHFHRRGPRR